MKDIDRYNRLCKDDGDGNPPIPCEVLDDAHEQVVVPDIKNEFSSLVGLSGGALVTYIVISEGSRLFPPRNLVPVP